MIENPAKIQNSLIIKKEARRVEKKPIKVKRFGLPRPQKIFLYRL
jgi:hypothetical protein